MKICWGKCNNLFDQNTGISIQYTVITDGSSWEKLCSLAENRCVILKKKNTGGT